MDGPEAKPSGPWLQRHALDLAVWALVLLAIIALAASAAWYLSNVRIELRPATMEDADRREGSFPDAALPAPYNPPPGPGVRRPTWLTQPPVMYPDRAVRAGVEEGAAQLTCIAEPSGRLSRCRVISETPAGYDFGANAVRAAEQARVAPQTVDGVATPSPITFMIRYRVEP